MIIKVIDGLSEIAGKLSAWALFAVGLFITFEVVMRYAFNAPTIWVDEVSRVLQVWVVYLAAAYVLKHREMVTIDLILRNPNTLRRKVAGTVVFVMLFLFAITAGYFGFELWLKETLAGHTTDTYLAPPKALTHAPVWVGSLLLILQGGVELFRVWTGQIPEDDIMEGAH